MEIIQFIFSDFWYWLGSTIMLAVVAGGIGGLFRRD